MKRIILFIITILVAVSAFAERTRQEIVRELFNSVEGWMGTPYVYGGDSVSGIDCSAFTARVYKKVFDVTLPRTVKHQKDVGVKVTGVLQPGDLLFFNIGGKISHVGVYVFDNKFIHAASAGPMVGIVKSSLNESYYKKRYVYAKRLVTLPKFTKTTTSTKKHPLTSQDSTQPQDKNEKVAIHFGGNLPTKKLQFDANKQFYFVVKNKASVTSDYYVTIKNLATGKKQTLSLFDLPQSKQAVTKLKLKKGNYSLAIYSDSLDVLQQKIIELI